MRRFFFRWFAMVACIVVLLAIITSPLLLLGTLEYCGFSKEFSLIATGLYVLFGVTGIFAALD